jgi:hypothetical protein
VGEYGDLATAKAALTTFGNVSFTTDLNGIFD